MKISTGGLKIIDNQLEETDNLLEVLQNTRIATFGDSDHLKPGDWIQIMLSKLPSDTFGNDVPGDVATLPGKCQSMVLNLHIEIAFAKIGSFANPQSKIIGVNYKFGSSQDVAYQCIGFGACKNPSKTQRIEISSSVEFIDVTRPASDYYAEYPVIEARLPHDFFYPFLTSLTSSGTKNRILTDQSFHLIMSCILISFCLAASNEFRIRT